MTDMVFTLVHFITGYLLKLCHVGLQLKISHLRPRPLPDLQFQTWPRPDLKKIKSGATLVLIYKSDITVSGKSIYEIAKHIHSGFTEKFNLQERTCAVDNLYATTSEDNLRG